ncbi:MAG: hypothetical protein BJ554DRAFT_1189 [Olpidium bornovanus]|uniref:Uncharacterized protein n=1 Tax=Olpidium bornovanus TaxID=278681 RepID=A0A8H7ZSH8_9FUNG|nr:MAG: hypothetical protein BJ554DRAFT_1189 [Olpidium bornovanus]
MLKTSAVVRHPGVVSGGVEARRIAPLSQSGARSSRVAPRRGSTTENAVTLVRPASAAVTGGGVAAMEGGTP